MSEPHSICKRDLIVQVPQLASKQSTCCNTYRHAHQCIERVACKQMISICVLNLYPRPKTYTKKAGLNPKGFAHVVLFLEQYSSPPHSLHGFWNALAHRPPRIAFHMSNARTQFGWVAFAPHAFAISPRKGGLTAVYKYGCWVFLASLFNDATTSFI